MSDRSNFGATTTADEVLEGIDLSGKLVVITGGASGLGQETARAMATKGAHIVIPVRDMAKGEAAVAAIKTSVPDADIELMECELGKMASIQFFAEAFLVQHDQIDLLINNAGVMACPHTTTSDGLEMQFGTNHIGHFLLTNLLIPALVKTAKTGGDARIINLSSRGHHFDTVHFDDPHFETRDYDKWLAYGQAKTANIMFTVGLEKRLADKGVHALSVHPGGIRTNLGRHLTEDDIALLLKRMDENADEGFTFKTVEAGAATSCYAATAPELEGKGGVYLEDCHIADVDDEDPNGSVRSYAVDPGNAEKLWTLSEATVGQTFSY
ncbi:SDR family NAD(P)-dependent oxidoreductase [Parasphingorhabdus sp.]|uniref:SDR family NAD(P)-dependent oxidoreductase n=1 Tax=Parasphingorhabdus sp. TaxID=2709688 RepID=UPI0035942EB2